MRQRESTWHPDGPRAPWAGRAWPGQVGQSRGVACLLILRLPVLCALPLNRLPEGQPGQGQAAGTAREHLGRSPEPPEVPRPGSEERSVSGAGIRPVHDLLFHARIIMLHRFYSLHLNAFSASLLSLTCRDAFESKPKETLVWPEMRKRQ